MRAPCRESGPCETDGGASDLCKSRQKCLPCKGGEGLFCAFLDLRQDFRLTGGLPRSHSGSKNGNLRRFTFNINNFCLQSAGFVVRCKCRIIFRKCFLKKSIRHLEKITRHLVDPEIRKKIPSDAPKRKEKARVGAALSILLTQRYNIFSRKANREFSF